MECAAFHKVMQVLYKNANEWGIVALSYMAAACFPDYNDMQIIKLT
jgi:hypothetical protein